MNIICPFRISISGYGTDIFLHLLTFVLVFKFQDNSQMEIFNWL